jgi:hypothetical protein
VSGYEVSLILGSLVVALMSRGNPRGIAWIAAITADLLASTAYWRADLPYAEVFTGLCDAAICFGIYFIGRYRWEMWLWRLYQGSVLISILYLGAHVFRVPSIDQDVYSSMLEAVNWIALISIGGASVLQKAGPPSVVAFSPWRRFRGAVYFIYREDRPTSARKVR